jgi:hypothetical protein
VRVREQDSVDHGAHRPTRRTVEFQQLPRKVRRGVDHPTLAARRIHDAEADDAALIGRGVPARIAERARLRDAAVLRDSEHDRERRIARCAHRLAHRAAREREERAKDDQASCEAKHAASILRP